MLKNPNPRIKNLYNNKCSLHSDKCVILDELTKNLYATNIIHMHLIDASNTETKIYLDNLPPTLEYLEVFNLNFDLTNLPINLKKLYVVSYKKFNIKVPFGCEFIERIMYWDPTEYWIKTISNSLIKSVKLEIGGFVIDEIDNEKINEAEKYQLDSNSHTGRLLDPRTKIIYEIAKY